jgi:beta-glucosidase
MRIDQMDRSGHYARWEEDIEGARAAGVTALRYAPPYYRAHRGPDRFDWEISDDPMNRLRSSGIEPIAELCRFGVPDWLGGFQDVAFPVLFAEYARAFAQRYPWVRYYVPVSAIQLTARRSALEGVWNECEKSDRTFVRALRNMALANELAIEAVQAVRPDAVFIQLEPVEHVHSIGASTRESARRANDMSHLALDMVAGDTIQNGLAGYLNSNGLTSNDLRFLREHRARGNRWLGLEYLPDSERRIAASGRVTVARRGAGFRRLALEYHQRYRLPLACLGTHHDTRHASAWLSEQWRAMLTLRATGVPVNAFGWSPLVDPVRWDAESGGAPATSPVGLYAMDRKPRPVRDSFRELVQRWSPLVGARSVQSATG